MFETLHVGSAVIKLMLLIWLKNLNKSESKRCFQCSPMAVGPSDISGNDWLGPINSSRAADRMSDEIFGANLVSLAEI